MTDPGWDIPGLPREEPSAAGRSWPDTGSGSSAGAGESRTDGKRRSNGRPTGSVSALNGSSAGAFARPGGSAGPSQDDVTQLAAASSSLAAAGSSLAAPSCTCAPSSPDAASGPGPSSVPSSASPSSAARPLPPAVAVPAGWPGAGGVRPDSPAEALAFVSAGLEFLAHADPAEWGEGLQADCLRALAVAESRQAAAHAKVLSAFSVPGGGLAGDGHRSPRVWLTWQCAARRCLT